MDFGKIGEKFDAANQFDLDMFFFTIQIPEVLMGRGSIPEGLAKVQLESFMRRINSIQMGIEKVIEGDIFQRILISNKIQAHVEFEWGQPSLSEKNERITKITELLKLNLSPTLSKELQIQAADILGLNAEELRSEMENEREEEREKEESEPQPKVPGQNRDEQILRESLPDEWYGQEMQVREWLGFNYSEYQTFINTYIDEDNFDDLRALSNIDSAAGKLNPSQIERLKVSLKDGFEKGAPIRDIAQNIEENVRPGNLFKVKNGKLVTDALGKPIVQVSSAHRAIGIARTETTRSAVGGSLLHYGDGGINRVSFVASFGPRTCPICDSLNGQVFILQEANGVIPVHTMCRCSFIPVVEL